MVEVVGDEQQRHAEARLQILQQLQDLRLDRHVERRRRLVGDQDVGLVGERHRDHHALALAARELVRIGVEPALGVGQADELAAVRACAARAAARPRRLCRSERLGDLLLDRVQRIERGHRLLEHHRDRGRRGCRAASRACAPTSSWPSKRMLLPGRGSPRVGQQLQDRQRRHRFARAALADQRQGLAALEIERDAFTASTRRAAAGEGDGEIADFEQSKRPAHSRHRLSRIEGVAHGFADEDQQAQHDRERRRKR